MIASSCMCDVIPASAEKRDNSIRFAYQQVVENIDPYFNSVRGGFIISQHVWDTLIYRDPRPTNTRASSRPHGPNRRPDLELELRKGVRFHNGDELTRTTSFTPLTSSPVPPTGSHPTKRRLDRARRKDRPVQGAYPGQAPLPGGNRISGGPVIIHSHRVSYQAGPAGHQPETRGFRPLSCRGACARQICPTGEQSGVLSRTARSLSRASKGQIRFIPDRQTQVAECFRRHRFHHERDRRSGTALRGMTRPAGRVRRADASHVPTVQCHGTGPRSHTSRARVRKAISACHQPG